MPDAYDELGSCYIEFGLGSVARVDVDFLSGPKPTGTFRAPSADLVAEKTEFGASSAARWFRLELPAPRTRRAGPLSRPGSILRL